MANEWPRVEVAQLLARSVLAIGDGYRAKNEELGGVGLPFCRAGNIQSGFDFADADRYPAANLGRVGDKISRPGDAVFTSKGTVGRFAFVTQGTETFVYSPQLCYWRSLEPGVLDSRYLYYWMLSPEFAAQYRAVAGQTDMADYVSLGDQRRMWIRLPDIRVQRGVGATLRSLDDKIELNRRMSETLEATAQALFKSWFVDFDPVRAKADGRDPGLPPHVAELFPDRLVDSELGEIPAGWSIRGLDQIARFLNGLALQKYPPEEGFSLPVIKIAQLHSGTACDADRATADLEPDYVVEDGDVLFSWSGSLECVLWAGGRGALNQHLFRVSSSEFPKWLYYLWIKHHLADFRQIAEGKATTMGHIQRHHLSAARVVLPPSRVLTQLDAVVAPLIDGAWRRRVESRTLAVIRDSLLPGLISGELRVPTTEAIAESAP